ncbi:dihydroorotase [Paucilactobacillus kaifaensis]|uniref:dihydroorotase n=1 Tax=Paucilactobacillus kaifaensis TaxID=2559921 RepID=UPI0010F93383|nr:dihydroorotase [Paucilactobacillus kaifaensis]
MSLLLKNGRSYIDGHYQKVTILVENGRVKQINGAITTADQVIDVNQALISPGLVDVHVHLREPGFTNKETIKTGSAAAAHGGFTTIGAMANLNPTPDNAQRFREQTKLNQSAVVKVKQYAPVTKQRLGQEVVHFDELERAGAFAFSDDGSSIDNAAVMYAAMQQIANLKMILCDHAQDMNLTHNGVINSGPRAEKLGVLGINNVSETAQIARNLALAKATGVHYHVCHVSTKESIELIRVAKASGVNVTCEVTPHHLLLDDTEIIADNAQFKMNPPLRSTTDRLACIAGLMDGTIDLIATDHAPHTEQEKKLGLSAAPNGIVGSETAFALLYTRFVQAGIWPLNKLIDWMSGAPKRVFNLNNVGQLKIGDPADIAVFDLKNTAEINAQQFLSKGHNSPFIGQSVLGTTVMTLVDGRIVYQREADYD